MPGRVSTADDPAPAEVDLAARPRPTGARPRWRSLGLAALLGLAAGSVLFPTKAHGREGPRPRRE